MPRGAWLLIVAALLVLLAIAVTPLFPAPLGFVLTWLAWIAAAVLGIWGVIELAGVRRGRDYRDRL